MYNITDGFLEDVEGAAHTVVYNGGKTIEVPQLGYALVFDGKDDWVDTGGFNADCVTDPSTCQEGFTLTFWLKVYSTGFIISSGSFTNHRNGPGFQLYYHQSLKRFQFLLETRNKRWTLLIHQDVGYWTHMAFTWHNQNGLKYYEDGNLSTFTDRPVLLSPLRLQNYTPVITLARPSTLRRFKEFGKFEISQLAIWLKDLSADDIAGVYSSGVIFFQDTILCCYFKGVNPCLTNPCHDGDACGKLSKSSEKKCICPNVNLRMKTCTENITGVCEDKSTGCRGFAEQSYYCKHRKMREICPRSCSYCGASRPSTTLKPTLSTGSTLMSRIARGSRDPVTPAPSSSPSQSKKNSPTTPSKRRLPRGQSCKDLQCPPYAKCFQTSREGAECRCQFSCSKEERNLICGTDDKTYLNHCVLKMEACRLGKSIRIKSKGGMCSVLFSKATHYLPLNFTREDKTKLVDMRGNATGMVFNTINASTAEQIGQVLRLNGIDNYIELNNLKDECITNPSKCTEGLSVAFWIKYTEGKFIISAGRYTEIADDGPGFRFICSNCSRNSGVPETHNSGIFLLELSTTTKKWRIHLDTIPRWWFHFAFTWSPNQGLKYYKNGKFVLGKKNPERFMVATDTNIAKMITIGLPNSLKAMSRKNSRGKFSLGHLVIWTHEVSKYDMEIAFLSVLTTGIKSVVCCQQLREDPCVRNPCHDGATCQRMDTGDKYQCICPDTVDHNVGRCSGGKPKMFLRVASYISLFFFFNSTTDPFQSLKNRAKVENSLWPSWKIARMYHLCSLYFLALLNISICESFSLYSSSNSSSVISPLRATLLTYTPHLSGATYGQNLRPSHEQFLQNFSLETTPNSVNDEFLSKFGVYTGKEQTPVSKTDLLVSSSRKVEAQIAHETQRSRHSVGKTLQNENRGAESTNRSGLTRPMQNKMIKTGSVQLDTITAQEFLSTFPRTGSMSTRERFQNYRFSAGSLVQPNMAMSTTNSFIILSPSSMVPKRYSSATRTRHFSVLSSHEKFTGSSLLLSNNLVSTHNLSPGAESSKSSSLLSHYSSGVSSAQARQVSTSQRTTHVSSIVTSSAINQVTSSFISPATNRISPLQPSSIISRTPTTQSFSSSLIVKSSVKSAWSKTYLHLTKAITSSYLIHTASVQPLLSSVVPTHEETSLTCRVNNTMCLCFNCDEAPKSAKICCMDLIENKITQQGIKMTVKNISVQEFYHIITAVSRVIADIVWNSCRTNVSLCLTGESSPGAGSVRRRRSLREQNIQSKPTSDRIRTKREALQPTVSPSSPNIFSVEAIFYSLSLQVGTSPGVQTAFYVIMKLYSNGTNQTILLDGKRLLKILTNETHTLESKLNISIESFTATHQSSKLATTSSLPATLSPNSSQGSQNIQMTTLFTDEATTAPPVRGKLEDEDGKGLSQELLILIICAGIGGLILISIVMACVFTRFYRQRKGEFVPDKTYPSPPNNKHNGDAGGEDLENIDTFIDPSTQITDVPHKPTRGSAGGSAGGPKKQRKPMGVKVTYKPPEWD
ncbi:unnamed protein product [Porites evermanni]|uniref:Uncharacterized protein n=1 Tax=Porites evermanni TaxID=104178 RepID=A0ABN8LVV0_9CNID|nr:unnamed protein product [Porites evermanni]